MTVASPPNALAQVPDWRDEITLVPYSGLQILDFGFRQSDLDLRPMRFVERVVGRAPAGTDEETRVLLPVTDDEEAVGAPAAPPADDDEYGVSVNAALEPFLGQWIPVPVLRLKNGRGADGEELYDPGPSAWAQARTVRLAAPDPATGHTHRVQLALDTALAPERSAGPYVAPDRGDALGSREFRLVCDPARMDWFLRRVERDEAGAESDPQRWVSDRIEDLFMAHKRAERGGRRFSAEMLPHRLEHWARYLAYLRLLGVATKAPLIRLVNTLGAHDSVAPIEVDLVLDVGNSRTCGIFIERLPGGGRIDPGRSYPLEIRDLSAPEFLYRGLLESRVEFADFRLCEEAVLRRARRAGGFAWPSPVRIGPEALRLVAGELGTETASGLSSPKRYIWDDAPVAQDWRFHHHLDPTTLPAAARSPMRFVNGSGDVIGQVRREEAQRLRVRGRTPAEPAVRPRFSRSSLFGFMLAEVFAHALVQVNSPGGRARRAQSDLPRRLSRIILTLPTATSIQEQAIIRSRAQGALSLIWSILRLGDAPSALSPEPQLTVDWDEASCTQLVYLYSEITQKFGGEIDRYLALKGSPRRRHAGAEPQPSLRLACIDIGGGTTDLMVTTYWARENRVLEPVQTMREGFRVAGDELVQRVISGLVLPRLRDAITEAGAVSADRILRELFSGNVGGQDQQVVQSRRQFALRVLQPAALAILGACEAAGDGDTLAIDVGHVLGRKMPSIDLAPLGLAAEETGVPEALLAYLEGPARDRGAEGFRLAGTTLRVARAEVDAIARETFQKVIGHLAEVIDHLGADLVLLTGRPSRLPIVRTILEEMLVVPPHRLVSMHRYSTGRWYPFRDPVTHRIGDPKSTVAVGGMLIALAEGEIPNFKVTAEAFRMSSTAHHLGEMEPSGRIPADRVLFHAAELSRVPSADTATLRMFSPVFLGARQLPLERWTTTPLYRIDYATPEARRLPSPLVITLRQADFDDGDDRPEAALRREAAREALEVEEIEDGEGNPVRRDQVVLRLQTLGAHDDYWIDTGLFNV